MTESECLYRSVPAMPIRPPAFQSLPNKRRQVLPQSWNPAPALQLPSGSVRNARRHGNKMEGLFSRTSHIPQEKLLSAWEWTPTSLENQGIRCHSHPCSPHDRAALVFRFLPSHPPPVQDIHHNRTSYIIKSPCSPVAKENRITNARYHFCCCKQCGHFSFFTRFPVTNFPNPLPT